MNRLQSRPQLYLENISACIRLSQLQFHPIFLPYPSVPSSSAQSRRFRVIYRVMPQTRLSSWASSRAVTILFSKSVKPHESNEGSRSFQGAVARPRRSGTLHQPRRLRRAGLSSLVVGHRLRTCDIALLGTKVKGLPRLTVRVTGISGSVWFL